MSEVVQLLPPRSNLPADLPDMLRDIAAKIEAGEITEWVAAFVTREEYQYMWSSSLEKCILLTSMLQHRACARMGCGTPDHSSNHK